MTTNLSTTLSPEVLANRLASALDFYRKGWKPSFFERNEEYNKGYNLPPQEILKELLFQVLSINTDYLSVEYDDTKLNEIADRIHKSYCYSGSWKDILSEIWNIPIQTYGSSDIWEDIDVDAMGLSVTAKYGFTVISDYFRNHHVFDNPIGIESVLLGLEAEF
jgi:hypothetical protein